jgi:hypothetical protein
MNFDFNILFAYFTKMRDRPASSREGALATRSLELLSELDGLILTLNTTKTESAVTDLCGKVTEAFVNVTTTLAEQYHPLRLFMRFVEQLVTRLKTIANLEPGERHQAALPLLYAEIKTFHLVKLSVECRHLYVSRLFIDMASYTAATIVKFKVSIVAENQLSNLGSHSLADLNKDVFKPRPIVSVAALCHDVF